MRPSDHSEHNLPQISFLIPVYNAEKHIGECLASIYTQDYPGEKLEVLILDGGSTDGTLEMAKKFPVRILHNRNRDAESGGSLGIENSKGEIIAILGADNGPVSRQWLREMVRPLVDDPEIFGVEPSWLVDKNDPIANRYCMHLEVADPFVYCLMPNVRTLRQNGYSVVEMTSERCPITGGGFLWRKSVILSVGEYKPKFEEINFFFRVIQRGFRKYAKVPEQKVYHHYVSNLHDFIRKRLKIGRKFLKRVQKKQVTWVHMKGKKKFVFAVLFCATAIGPAFEAVRGYKRTKDIAWFLHPFMSFLTISVYSVLLITHPVDVIGY